jgi:hypothetical protein
MQKIVVGGEVSWRAPAEIGERRPGLRCADLFNLNFGMFARRGHQRCHCNEEGFGTLSPGSSEIMKVTAVPARL